MRSRGPIPVPADGMVRLAQALAWPWPGAS